MDEIRVLNGRVKVGDRIAVAITAGRHGCGMRVGEVLELVPGGPRVKVRVDLSSGYHFQPVPYTKTYDDPARMVKLGALQDAL
jgi:hypothetical protein